ncbi:MAG: radical SAM protein, partial [Bradymonadaceae bacterium]
MKHVSNPPNPWADGHVEWLGEPPEAELKVFEEEARSILTENQSPDLPFQYSVNPFRGCFHRPTHEYLDFGAGTDFERRIVVKTNAPALLRERLRDPEWAREPINFSGVTDCYQPLEQSYEATRGCLEVCAEIGNPVCIVTKGALVRRDVDVLTELQERAPVRVYVSIPFANDEVGRAMEPHATVVSQRFKTLEVLAEAGIPTGVAIAPIIPGLNDSDIPEILSRAADAGVQFAFHVLLRLPGSVEPVFIERLREEFPDRADRVLSSIRDVRDGELNATEFGDRMVGKGPRWKIIESLFETHCQRLG